MSKGLPVLLLMMTGLTFGAFRASTSGYGVPQPMKKPVSIREGSVHPRTGRSGRHRSHYFVGGGFHGGK
ncbi:MAG: hypothetical protein HN742_01875 [Lentisphaerae bacterium]|jgi:hypothetical protein|nr:hypothetical protein [Lentisphaerota bacterium]MBT4820709.1 hypothetical protein [Lentisphaerota bacterium]MBT5612356.1 hypothetical protein [Lentisphaerota bacterium]MBT7056660.1 hypothetical protein [Lentisphaerota bacterium]MBT7840585.1 hypothetical protein [Lentisphaerota bacterium]